MAIPSLRYLNLSTAPLSKKNKERNPSTAKIFEVYITIFVWVMANTAGMESRAKTISVVASNIITTKSMVKYFFPLIIFVKFPITVISCKRNNFFQEFIYRIFFRIKFFLIVDQEHFNTGINKKSAE